MSEEKATSVNPTILKIGVLAVITLVGGLAVADQLENIDAENPFTSEKAEAPQDNMVKAYEIIGQNSTHYLLGRCSGEVSLSDLNRSNINSDKVMESCDFDFTPKSENGMETQTYESR